MPFARHWLEKASERNNPEAQYDLGVIYLMGMVVEKDFEKSIALFQKSARAGNSDAQNELGIIFEYGIGVKKDILNAINVYKKAAASGNTKAKEAIKRLL